MFKGKTAIVTGSTSGIGIATALAAEDCALMLKGSGDSGEKSCGRISRASTASGSPISHPDMSKPAQSPELVADTSRHFGCVDVLINTRVIEFPEDRWAAVIAINMSKQAREDLLRCRCSTSGRRRLDMAARRP